MVCSRSNRSNWPAWSGLKNYASKCAYPTDCPPCALECCAMDDLLNFLRKPHRKNLKIPNTIGIKDTINLKTQISKRAKIYTSRMISEIFMYWIVTQLVRKKNLQMIMLCWIEFMKYKVKKIHNCHNYIGGLNSVRLININCIFLMLQG